jgi:hypothetical protein
MSHLKNIYKIKQITPWVTDFREINMICATDSVIK